VKPNPEFDDLTATWWRLTHAHIPNLVFGARAYAGDKGRYGDFSRMQRRLLRKLCLTRRDVHRAGTAI
jgi:hypothetical protein